MSILQLQPTITDLELPPSGDFSLSRVVWDANFAGEKVSPSWVHLCAAGLSKLNQFCSFAFRRHWKKKTISRKSSIFVFKARAYCTFSGCNVSAMLLVKSCDVASDEVTIHVECSGRICHTIGEKHARRFSHCIRKDLYKSFQDTHIAPSKEYLNRLLKLTDEQFAAGNRDAVGATTSVLKKISSEARLVQQEHTDLVTSLTILRKKLIDRQDKAQVLNKKITPIQGFIQCIQAHPFSVICFNDTSVRLYHEMAKYSPLFCDATGTIVSVPKIDSVKTTVYYYSIVIKHPVDGKAPIPVAELITNDHTVLSLCYFMETFRRAEGLVFGFSAITNPLQFIIDRSMVLLLSILHVYNSESLQDYLERTFRIVTGSGTVNDFRKVSPHACTSHVMHSASKNCKKW